MVRRRAPRKVFFAVVSAITLGSTTSAGISYSDEQERFVLELESVTVDGAALTDPKFCKNRDVSDGVYRSRSNDGRRTRKSALPRHRRSAMCLRGDVGMCLDLRRPSRPDTGRGPAGGPLATASARASHLRLPRPGARSADGRAVDRPEPRRLVLRLPHPMRKPQVFWRDPLGLRWRLPLGGPSHRGSQSWATIVRAPSRVSSRANRPEIVTLDPNLILPTARWCSRSKRHSRRTLPDPCK